jgi:hypothetical protein
MQCKCGEEMVYLGIDGNKEFYSCPICGMDYMVEVHKDELANDDGQ